jgi:hypothetical protein
MKRATLTALLFAALCSTGFGVVMWQIQSPPDDITVISDPTAHPELRRLCEEYRDLLAVRFDPLNIETNIVSCFGAKLNQPPGDRAKPSFVPWWMSGSGFVHTPNKRHTDYYAIGDIGYLEVYFDANGMTFDNRTVYFRTDDQFVPLKSTADFPKRLKWEETKFDALKKWFGDHLPTIPDLGVVEVSASGPTRVALGTNLACIIKTEVVNQPGVTNAPFQPFLISVAQDIVPVPSWAYVPTQRKSIDHPDQPVSFSVEGKFYRLTPKLVPQLPGPNQ